MHAFSYAKALFKTNIFHFQAVLSLLAAGGGAGLPYAHVLSYQADMALLVEAAQAVAQACQEGSQVAFSPVVGSEQQAT